MDLGQADELATALRELRAIVAAQAIEIADLRQQLAGVAHTRRASETLEVVETPELAGRRRFLALAGGAAAVAAGTLVAAGATPAAAASVANGEDIGIAVINHTSGGTASSTVLDYSTTTSGQVDYLRVSDKATSVTAIDPFYARYLPAAVAGHARTTPDRIVTGVTGLSEVEGGNGVVGIATGAGGAYGVWGISDTGNGVVGRSASGYDFFADGSGRIGLSAHVFVGPPQGGSYTAGDLIRDSQGALWACVITGSPGVWRKLAGPTTAGAFHAVSPTRVYDSRWQRPNTGFIGTNESRTISVADGRRSSNGEVVSADLVPAGATAIACNITITDTFGSGFAVVNPGQDSSVGASTINWSHSDQTLANGIIVGVDEDRRVTLVVGGGGATNIVVDVSGFFL